MDEAELSKLKKKRGMVKSSLTRFKSFLDNYREQDYRVLKLRFEKAKSLLSEFENIHSDIEIAEDSNDDDSRILFENNYYEQIARAEELLNEGNGDAASVGDATGNADVRAVLTQLSNLTSNETGVKLPTITLPKFDGKYEEWLNFEDSFKVLIHDNVKIQTVQKFNYLKSCLVRNAAQIIQSLSSTAENYEIAWNLLKERYSNKRIIIQNHVKALFELQTSKESALGLSALIDTALRHIQSLQILEQPVGGWDALLLHLIGSKVDKKTRIEWEKSLEGTEMPTLDQYLKFLRNRCHVLEVITTNVTNRKNAVSNKASNSNKIAFNKPKQVLLETQAKDKCHVCGENHNLPNCEKFRAMSHADKTESIKKAGLCFNCFRANHRVKECKASSCRKCERRHHTMLHNPAKSSDAILPTPQGVEHNKEQVVAQAATQSLSSRLKDTSLVILSTAMVDIADALGQYHPCRVVLDAGSQSNFISEQFCDKLRLHKKSVDIPVSGIGETLSYIKSSTMATVKSRINSFVINIDCLVITKVTEVLPSKIINCMALGIPENIILADPTFDQPNQIDMLIGAEHFYQLLCVGQIRLNAGKTILQKTRFGWVVSGKIETCHSIINRLCHLSRSPLEDMVHKFWETEELPARKILSPEEEECEKHYQQSVRRLPSGHYSVGLLFNDKKEKLGESYGIALKRFYALERRLSANPKLYEDYRNFLKEYEALGHMTRIEDTSLKDGYFLPHHAVLKESSTTTRLRVVFNASEKTTTGISLNDVLLTGSVDQNSSSIFTRFRSHPVVYTADIEKMYRQVFIHPEDRQYQKILWRDDPEEPIQIFVLNTLTYGMTSAAYVAIQTLEQLAQDEAQRYPEASEVLTEDTYVDDVLSGNKTVEQALTVKRDLTDLSRSGGFNLRKWASNHPFLNEERKTNHEAEEHICLDSSDIHRALGILWNPQQDCLLYRVAIQPMEVKVTKRTILSQIASLYDPLGLLGPVIVKAKILLQGLWKLQLTWDQAVPEEIYTAWKTFQDQKGELNKITFPRQICVAQHVNLQLHGFADASEAAYGACLYIRSTNAQQSHYVALVRLKSKIAPLKRLTLPRLELCTALLLSKLCEFVLKALKMTFDKKVLWSDSTIALQWIHTPPHRLKTFVANRVAPIQEITSRFEWRHIASHDNPAYLVSRGLLPSDIVGDVLWISGPGWLSENEDNWPNFNPTLDEVPEQRTTISLKAELNFDILRRFSSFTMLRRVVAWWLRFINNCRAKDKIEGNLSSFELTHAMHRVVKLVQLESFANEMRRLEAGKLLKQNSNLISLHPFLDSSGIMRVGGRLENASLKYEQKHQIILPGKHHVTDLIIRDAHISQLHAGPQATLYCIRQRFWPVHGKKRIRKIIHECVTCFKAKPKMLDYEMGNLPKDRFESTRPFSNSGVDYCGPFWIKERKQRNRSKVKVYVAVFVCLATKAVHLELVSDLTTEAFIAALKRLFSRRGKANIMLSDNATNFVGTRNELQELYDFINTQSHKEKTNKWLSEQEVVWKFIPPRSPHFGGIWETAVRSFKHHLHRVAKDTLFTFE